MSGKVKEDFMCYYNEETQNELLDIKKEIFSNWTIGCPLNSLHFFHRVLSNIYDDEKLNKIFHNDIGIRDVIFFTLESYLILKFTSDLVETRKMTKKGYELLKKLEEIFGGQK